jgi:putative transposase
MLRLLTVSIAALLSGLRSRRELILENLALRQQLATVLQKRRPRIGPADRAFWVVLRRLWSRWSDAVVIVKPETVIGWHRAGFALSWKWLSRRGRLPGRPAVGREVRDLVRRMASENGWGATRIHGELLKLGFTLSERTVSRYLRQHGRWPERRQSWLTFLRNHREVLVAMDFFVVPTATFRLLYVWFAIRHSRREIVHWSVTETPTAPWVVQQLWEAFPVVSGRVGEPAQASPLTHLRPGFGSRQGWLGRWAGHPDVRPLCTLKTPGPLARHWLSAAMPRSDEYWRGTGARRG